MTNQEALARIRDREWLGGPRYQEQLARVSWAGVHPDIKRFARLYRDEAAKHGVPLYVHTAWRSWTEQAKQVAEGDSLAPPGKSPHNWGLAVDVVHGRHHWEMDRKSWELLGHLGKEVAARNGIAVDWGGAWRRPWDPAHWQLSNWREKKDVELWPKG